MVTPTSEICAGTLVFCWPILDWLLPISLLLGHTCRVLQFWTAWHRLLSPIATNLRSLPSLPRLEHGKLVLHTSSYSSRCISQFLHFYLTKFNVARVQSRNSRSDWAKSFVSIFCSNRSLIKIALLRVLLADRWSVDGTCYYFLSLLQPQQCSSRLYSNIVGVAEIFPDPEWSKAQSTRKGW